MNICILGSNGMLGSQVLSYFSRFKSSNITATIRDKSTHQNSIYKNIKNVNFLEFNFDNLNFVLKDKYDFIINCIGQVKPRFQENDKNSIKSNILLPHFLKEYIAKNIYSKVYQIATDCVFSGLSDTPYNENSNHDAIDDYGKTKSLGEIKYKNFYNLRCSIIGRELINKYSLLEWFLNCKDKEINGFTNHKWNGITTFAYAKIVRSIIIENIDIPNSLHIIPSDIVTKYELLQIFKKAFKKDIKINKFVSPIPVNRVLNTNFNYNELLWSKAGYETIPTISELVNEL